MDDDFTDVSEHELLLRRFDQLEALVKELVEAKRELEKMAEDLKGKSPLALMSMFK